MRYSSRRTDEMDIPNKLGSSSQGISSSSRNRVMPEAVESAMGVIKDAMAQYANCADPSESAARKERLKQAEASGVIENNAVRMVRNSIVRESTNGSPEIETDRTPPQERTPISARLGPLNGESPPSERIPISARLGPINGESPELENLAPSSGTGNDRVPISSRLGPLTVVEETEPATTTDIPPIKKEETRETSGGPERSNNTRTCSGIYFT